MVNREEALEALNMISMQIILHAGDARNDVMEALKQCEEENFDGIEELLNKANANIVKAHKIQTETVQSEARGEEPIFSLLFAHAQDHIMTVKSEYEMAKRIILLFNKLNKRIDTL